MTLAATRGLIWKNVTGSYDKVKPKLRYSFFTLLQKLVANSLAWIDTFSVGALWKKK